ncbi:hypothetical protein [Dokdonia sp.]|uniref:hypothetical protein n=1 Tax=Dokdonia sp. TaxID=2024995 RepID=UPI0032674FA1
MIHKTHTKYIVIVLFLSIALSPFQSHAQSLKQVLKTYKKDSKVACEKKGGYWYQGKCWANFSEFDDGISVENIDSEVEKQLETAEKYGISVDGIDHEIDFFFPEIDEEEGEILFITLFKDENGVKTLLQIAPLKKAKKKSFEANAILLNGNLLEFTEEDQVDVPSMIIAQGTSQVTSQKGDAGDFLITGSLTDVKEGKDIPFTMNAGEMLSGMGDTTLEIKGDEVFLNGTLGTKSYKQFKDLIAQYPEVKTIVLQNVPGSVNDAVNMHTGRIIREAGLTTKVLVDSQISSGGVDLFCAGKERIITQGAQLGIHSWGGGGLSADDFPKDHPAHQYQIAYFTMCLGEEIGPDFYFRTLEAAPAGEMHWMDWEEIKKWSIATQLIKH